MDPVHRKAQDTLEAAQQAEDDAARLVERAADRRSLRGGRRASDTPNGGAWTPRQLAFAIGMSHDFVLAEIRAGEIVASQFGREWRIATAEVIRYLTAKSFPLPESLAS